MSRSEPCAWSLYAGADGDEFVDTGSAEELAARRGVSAQNLRKCVGYAGGRVRERGRMLWAYQVAGPDVGGRRSPRHPTREFDLMAWDLHAQGLARAAIARRMNCSDYCVENALKRVRSGRYGKVDETNANIG